jgi:hypothetical protein
MAKVFLGGTCNGSQWRETLIPHLKIDYFNPVVDDWNEEAQKREIEERESADYVLYTITPKMKGVYSIAEVVDDSNKRPEKTILCILPYDGENKFAEEGTDSLEMVAKMVEGNGSKVVYSLKSILNILENE